MKYALKNCFYLLAAALLFAACAHTETEPEPAQTAAPPKLAAQEVKEALAEGPNLFFLDVRSPAEVRELGTLPGYVNIPVDQLEQRMSEVPKDKVIITACNHGSRAAVAAALLAKKGFKVRGSCGLAYWKEAGFDVIYPQSNGAE